MNDKDKELLKKLKWEQVRVEGAVYEYARRNGLGDFHCKWTNKDYNASDYNLPNMIFDFIDELEKQSE
jgi:hypothetical protein